MICKSIRISIIFLGKKSHQIFRCSILLDMEDIITRKPRPWKIGINVSCLFPMVIPLQGENIDRYILIIWTVSSEFGTYCLCEHSRSLARTFAAHSYKQWIKKNLQTESQIPGPFEWLGMRSWNLSWRNALRHKFAWRGSYYCNQCSNNIILRGCIVCY